jgi:glyoxylate reductase
MRVLISCKLPEEVVTRVGNHHSVIMKCADNPMSRSDLLLHVSDKEGLLCTISDIVDEELMEKASGLKMIANFGVGYDNIDVAAATGRGIRVSNTPGVLTDATADITFALILGVARRVVEADAITRAGKFEKWAPFGFLGAQVTGKTLGIVGLGRIGRAVAKRARAFDMPVLYHNRTRLDADVEAELGVTYTDLKSLLVRSDFVSLHVALTHSTRHLIGKDELDLMKRTAYLINASRGPVVDEKALLNALLSGGIAGAGLDVYENEPNVTPGLADLSNVVLLPHIGSATYETRMKMAMLAVDNLLEGLAGGAPPNCLNCGDA